MKLWKKLLVITLIVIGVCALAILWWRWPRDVPIAEADTVLVISPHPDDETYSMAQAIAEQVLAGKEVIGVLVTDGEGSDRVEEWTEKAGIDFDGDGDVDRWDFGLARRNEYVEAMVALGVDRLVFLGTSDNQGVMGLRDAALDTEEVEEALTEIADKIPEVEYMTTMQYLPDHRFVGDARLHEDHTAVCEATKSLASRRGETANFYKVYVLYRQEWWKRWAPRFVRGSDEAFERKQAAVDAYSEMGASSTPELWEAARESRIEYLVRDSDF